ncbi:MAG: HD-GYP domain-containing protein [Candidatus Sumerlaeaceae bacterium]|nr:HD-GYP domain-containing protein [Candidatus Sumerlaeaceae bacterium]
MDKKPHQSPLKAAFNYLTAPTPEIRDPGDRRDARLLAAFLLTLFFLFLCVIASYYAFTPGYRISPSDVAGFAYMACTYILTRTRLFRIAAFLLVAMFPLNTFANILSGTFTNIAVTLGYMVLSFMLCSIFLSIRQTALYGLLVNLTILFLPCLVPKFVPNVSTVIGPLCVNAMGTVLTLISMRHRDLLEADHQGALETAYEATLEGWARALELRDKETEGHSRRVTEISTLLAREAGMTDREIENLRIGSLLHDIGKMGIPDNILRKSEPLTPEEREVIERHPTLAYKMLSPIPYLRQALEIPHCHHERWDGRGYPRGLHGTEIPLSARLFAVADVWDALTHDRPYRPAWTRKRALEHIKDESGKQFDPFVVQLFLDMKLAGKLFEEPELQAG